jgi:hypothetical protein
MDSYCRRQDTASMVADLSAKSLFFDRIHFPGSIRDAGSIFKACMLSYLFTIAYAA